MSLSTAGHSRQPTSGSRHRCGRAMRLAKSMGSVQQSFVLAIIDHVLNSCPASLDSQPDRGGEPDGIPIPRGVEILPHIYVVCTNMLLSKFLG